MKEVQLNEQLKNLLQRNKDLQAKELNEIILGKTEEKRIHLQLPQRNILAFGTSLMMVFLILAAYQRSSYQQTRKLSEQKTGQHKQNNEHQNGFLYSVVDHPPQAQHKHPIAPLKYASLGIPHIGELFNYSKVCLSSFNEYEKHLYDYFRPYNDTDCQYEIYGSSGNQSYVLCKNFIRNSHALLNIGQDGKDSFGCSISSQFNIPNHLYQCKKHSYVQQYCQGNNKLTKFQRKCFGDAVQKIEDYEFTMLNRQIDLKGLEDKNIIVKMNVGGNQWVALRNNPLEYFQKVDQLILTVYLPHQSLRNTVYWGNIDVINSLRENFVSVYVHLNNLFRIKIVEMKEMQRRYSCAVFYVTLVNKRVIKLKSEDRSYNQKIKSYKNNPNDDYLQITEQ